MNKEELQVGDLVTLTREDNLGLYARCGNVGLLVALFDKFHGGRVVRVYWFRLGRVKLEWLSYLTKLNSTQEKENE